MMVEDGDQIYGIQILRPRFSPARKLRGGSNSSLDSSLGASVALKFKGSGMSSAMGSSSMSGTTNAHKVHFTGNHKDRRQL
jgi:hypothetical protein